MSEKQQRKIIEEKEIKARTKIVNFFSNLQTLNYFSLLFLCLLSVTDTLLINL